MKTYYKLITYLLIIGSSVLYTASVSAQAGNCDVTAACSGGSLYSPSGPLSTSSSSFTAANACTYAGEYNEFNVTIGNTYEWSMCPTDGATAGVSDDQLTLRNTSGTVLCASDDICSAHAKILWTATFTGVVQVLIDQYYCTSNSICNTMVWRQASGPSSGCTFTSSFGSATINTSGALVTISTCSYAGEYSTISGAASGQSLQFTFSNSGTGAYITVHSGSYNGPVVANGSSPLTFANSYTGTLYAHWSLNGACATEFLCHTTTVQCMNCVATYDPCASITTSNSCGVANNTVISAGSGLYAFAPYSPPSQERIYSFTPATTGNYTVTVNSNSFFYYTDFFYKQASGGCNGTGWTFLQDLYGSPVTSSNTMALTAGVPVYIMVDEEAYTSGGTVNWQVNCVGGYNPCAAISTSNSCGVANNTVISAGNGLYAFAPYSPPSQEKIYTFTPAATGNYSVTVNSNSFFYYTDFFYKPVSGGCNGTGWTFLQDVYSAPATSFNTMALTAGVPIYIMVDEEAYTSGGTVNWQVNCISGPIVNDNCSGALTLTCGGSVTGSTVGCTAESPTPPACTYPTNPGIWYTMTTPTAQNVTLSMCGSSYDTYLFVYSGSSCSGLSCVVANDDFCGLQSQVQFTSTAGGTYKILVSGYNSATGSFTLNATCTTAASAPVNDQCTAVSPVTLTNGVTQVFTGTTVGATTTNDGAFTAFPTVWHAITLTSCASLAIRECGTSPTFYDTWIDIATSCPANSFIQATSWSQDCGDGNWSTYYSNVAPGTYWIPVLGSEPGYVTPGPYTLSVTATANCYDPCASILTSNACGVANSTNITAGGGAYAFPPYGPQSQEKIYTFTPAATGNYSISVNSNSFFYYTDFFYKPVSGGCNGTGWTFLQDLYSAPATSGNVMSLTAGVPVYIMVDEEFYTSGGTVNWQVNCATTPPINDQCTSVSPVTLIEGTPQVFTGTTVGATSANDGAFTAFPTVWHAFTITSCESVSIRECGTSPAFLDTWIDIATACPANSFIQASSWAQDCGGGDNNWSTYYPNLAPGTYYVPVLGSEPGYVTPGPYTLTVTATACPPPACLTATPILCGSVSGTTVGGVFAGSPPFCGTTLTTVGRWYSFTPSFSGAMDVNTCGGITDYDTKLHVFTDCPSLVCVGGNDDFCGLGSQVFFTANAGTTYYVFVSGYSGTGNYTLNVNCPCPPISAPTVSTPATVCLLDAQASQSVSLTATLVSGGTTARWYDASTGGTLLATGLTYTTNASSTATVYASAYDAASGCESSTRTARTITVGHSFTLVPDADNLDPCLGDGFELHSNAPSGSTVTVSNTSSITINDVSSATPYPSNITVSGFSGTIGTMTVNLTGLSHTYSSDIDILLQSPTGVNVILMSDVGGGGALSNVTYTFSDAGAVMNASSANPSGTYHVTNSGTPDNFNSPGPGSFSQASPALSMFNGGSPNGTWKLFIMDDVGGDVGTISGGWSMTISSGLPTLTYNWTGDGTIDDPTASITTADAGAGPHTFTILATDPVGCQSTGSVTVTVRNHPTFTYTVTPVTCPGGSDGQIAVIASGIAPFEYNYCGGSCASVSSSTKTGLTVGTYGVAVSDAYCGSDFTNVTVTQHDGIAPQFTTCPSNITLSACTPTASWATPTATDNCVAVTIGQTAGPASGSTFANGTTTTITYTATDGGGNTATCSFTVTRKATLTVNAGGDEDTYFGFAGDQAVTHTAVTSGGTGAGTYSYSWTLLPYPQTTGTRSLMCNNVNGAGDETFSISGGTGSPTCSKNVCSSGSCPTPTPCAAPVCSGLGFSTVTLTLVDSARVVVTVTDGDGCVVRDTFIVRAEDARCFAGTNQKLNICHKTGSSSNPCVTLCIETNAWEAHSVHGDAPGKCPKNCTLKSDEELLVGENGFLQVYPNPTNGLLTVEFDGSNSDNLKLTVTNLLGQIVYSESVGSFAGHMEKELDLSHFSDGSYFVQVHSGNNSVFTKQIVLTK